MAFKRGFGSALREARPWYLLGATHRQPSSIRRWWSSTSLRKLRPAELWALFPVEQSPGVRLAGWELSLKDTSRTSGDSLRICLSLLVLALMMALTPPYAPWSTKVARAAQTMGRGTLLAKVDIASAYRLVPVHPQDRPLLGVHWYGSLYVDGCLPFGLRSAPKIFTALADALEWCFRRRGVTEVDHYLDDFITIGPPGDVECQCNLSIIQDVCRSLGVPLAVEKVEGPATCLTFLGIEIDTLTGVLRLPRDKVVRITHELSRWQRRRRCIRKQLESLIGILQTLARSSTPAALFCAV